MTSNVTYYPSWLVAIGDQSASTGNIFGPEIVSWGLLFDSKVDMVVVREISVFLQSFFCSQIEKGQNTQITFQDVVFELLSVRNSASQLSKILLYKQAGKKFLLVSATISECGSKLLFLLLILQS